MSRKRRQTAVANRNRTPPGATAEPRYAVRQTSFSGPLPPPNILAQYNEVVPGGAERILSMAEQNAAHRRAIEAKVVAGNVRAQALGSVLGFVMGMTVIILGSGLMYLGHEAKGFAMVVGTTGGLLWTYMWGRRRQERERDRKASAFARPPGSN